MRTFLRIVLAMILVASVFIGGMLLQGVDVSDAERNGAYLLFVLGFLELIVFGFLIGKRLMLFWIIFVQICLMIWSVYAYFFLNIHPAMSVLLFFTPIMVVLSALSVKHKSFI